MKDFVKQILSAFKSLLTVKTFVTPSRKRLSRRSLELGIVSPRKRKKVKKTSLPSRRQKIKRPVTIKKQKPIVKRKSSVLPKKSKVPAKVKKVLVKKQVLPAKKVKSPPAVRTSPIGQVTHYFSRIGVIVLKMTAGTLVIGETIHIKGKTTDLMQQVNSIQIESVDVKSARRGQVVGLKVDKEARPGDRVYKVI